MRRKSQILFSVKVVIRSRTLKSAYCYAETASLTRLCPPMGIDSHGNNGHSHSHTGCSPFLPIPIPNFVTNSHYHGNPRGFPFPLGIPADSHSHWESHYHGHLYPAPNDIAETPLLRFVVDSLCSLFHSKSSWVACGLIWTPFNQDAAGSSTYSQQTHTYIER